MKKKKIIALIAIFTLSLAFSASITLANGGIAFVGVTGPDTVDSDASFGGAYLRQAGNPAPSGFSHAYQWASPPIFCDPNNTPTVFTGSVEVSSMAVGDVIMVGLVDQSLLAGGYSGWFSGAYVYIHKKKG